MRWRGPFYFQSWRTIFTSGFAFGCKFRKRYLCVEVRLDPRLRDAD